MNPHNLPLSFFLNSSWSLSPPSASFCCCCSSQDHLLLSSQIFLTCRWHHLRISSHSFVHLAHLVHFKCTFNVFPDHPSKISLPSVFLYPLKIFLCNIQYFLSYWHICLHIVEETVACIIQYTLKETIAGIVLITREQDGLKGQLITCKREYNRSQGRENQVV